MKRILIVGADLTPVATRPRYGSAFPRHLRDYGWEPIVLTVDPNYCETGFTFLAGDALADRFRRIAQLRATAL